jgi:hypothetical protein
VRPGGPGAIGPGLPFREDAPARELMVVSSLLLLGIIRATRPTSEKGA